MDSSVAWNFISSVYYSTFMILFTIINLLILLIVMQKALNFLFSREEIKNSSYALITGCDTGFGYATTYELNKRGIHVFAACLMQQSVDRFKDDNNFKGTAFLMNVTKKEDIETAKCMIEYEVKDKGLWCLFNNAGVFEPGPIEWMSEEDMRRSTDINLWGAVNVTKAMLPMVKKARGRIINTTSIAGRISTAYWSSYHISKYAFEAFSDSLRYEMKPWGVSVHIIEPGIMQTNIYSQAKKRWKDLWEKQTKEMQEEYGEDFVKDILSTKRLQNMAGDPKQVVNVYVHAALSTRPQLRYLVGADAKFLALTMGLLPTYMGDTIYKAVFKPICPHGKKGEA